MADDVMGTEDAFRRLTAVADELGALATLVRAGGLAYRMRDVDELVSTLTERRKSLRINQYEIAKEVGRSSVALSQWELGRGRPSVEMSFEWAHALGLDIALIPRSADGD